MFLQTLLDPEDERRRRIRRARIVRRNRIKREVAQGLPLRRPRIPRPYDFTQDGEDRSEPSLPFRPTFGGNVDESQQERQGSDRVDHIRAIAQQSGALPKLNSPAAMSPPKSDVLPKKSTNLSASKQPDTRPMASHIRAKWREAFNRVVFQHHEEILKKDPNRKWRQERFGLLLYDKREYARASQHLDKAITLGASSSLCWRRLAESYLHMWEDGGEWDVLWACRAAFEQALNRVEVASNPFALLTYAKVLELLGNYTGALTICASILQTFPKFEQLREAKLRFVLLQRYQLFTSLPSSESGAVAALERQALLTKCIGYTQELLLDKAITEGPRHFNVLYLHTRLNELLEATATAAPGGQSQFPMVPKKTGKNQPPTTPKTRIALSNTDILFQELYKLATRDVRLAPPPGVKWKPWKNQCETYTTFAEYFRAQGENLLATDALSRSLDLLEALPPENEGIGKPVNPWRGMTDEQRRKRVAVYIVLARNYYQCNQMEMAIRAVETVFHLDPLHAEARASLTEWFPDKWQYRLDLEDSSQVQIARVLRGIWGRNIALRRRQEMQRLAEQKYRANPYHLGCRRHVLRLLRDKYASLFAAQDLAARCIQRRSRKYLHYARVRWKLEDRRDKRLRDLRSKYQTRKYRYNRQIRAQLAELLPNEYERKFIREEYSALRIQRCFRGSRTRRKFRYLRDARRHKIKREQDAAHTIQRFYRRYCRTQKESTPTADEILFRAQNQLARAKERLARIIQRRYRRWKASQRPKSPVLTAVLEIEVCDLRQVLEDTSTLKIQRVWRRYKAAQVLGERVSSPAQVFLADHFPQTQRRQTYVHADPHHAARRIQSLYRGRLMRRFLGLLRNRVLASPCASPIATLIAKCEKNHMDGIETLAELYSIDNLEEKRALFDHPVLVLRGARSPTNESFPLQHVVSAIQYSSLLKCLICASGDFTGDRILTLLRAIRTSRTLRVLVLGEIDVAPVKIHSNQEPDAANDAAADSMNSSERDLGGDDDLGTTFRCSSSTTPLGRRSLLLPSPPPSPQPHQKRQLGAMQIIAKALCTSNFLLEELYLERNTLLKQPQEGAIVAVIVSDYFFARYGHLHTLVVAHMCFSDANAVLLGAALGINNVLQKLDLHGNFLCDNAAIAIANDGLAHNKSLRYLNLAENTIGSAGAKALFRCLKAHNRSLQTLILRNNHLMSDVMPPLIEAWQVNAVVEIVDLSGNLISNGYLEDIRAATAERREVAASKESLELRLLLARKRFSCRNGSSATGGNGIRIFATTSPLKSSDRGKKKAAPLSPTKWLSNNAPKIISPLHYPVVANRHSHEMHPAPKFSVESIYSPTRTRKGVHKSLPVRLASPSKLPSLPAKKRLVW